jgi:putative ABC transport system permease protein
VRPEIRTTRLRFSAWLISIIGVIVPRRLRADWKQEWLAELKNREALLEDWERLDWRNRFDLFRRSVGAFWDALWLQQLRLEEEMFQDVRYGLRALRKKPAFTSIAAITLALGIGANTAIFSVINGVLLRPLPFTDPARLVMIWTDNPAYQLGFHEFPAANADLPEWRATATSFEEIAAFQTSPADLTGAGDPERVGGVEVTANLLPTLGIRPGLGRVFSAEEEQLGRDAVVVISHRLWQRRFGADDQIVGKTITVNSMPRVVIGVMPGSVRFLRAGEMPRAYNLPEEAELWMPLARDASYWQNRRQRQLVSLIGRLKVGVTQEQAQAEMDAISARQALDYPETHEGWRVWLTPLFNQMVGQTQTPLLVLFGAVGFLLLIACANIASLLLARASARRREIAVRLAIGAGRARIIRQLLTESVLLAVLGGGLGLFFGYLGLDVLLRFIPPSVPRLQDISLDASVLLFTVSISIITGVLFGLVPAWQASRQNVAEALKDAGRAASGGRGIRSHTLLVSAEVALVVVLLVGAVLMLQSLRRLLAIDPGFKPDNVASFEVSLPRTRYESGEQRARFFEQAEARLRGLAGVRASGAVSNLPLSSNESMNYFVVEGAEAVPRGKEPLAEDRVVTPGYFEAMGMSLISGRGFSADDSAAGPLVAIINETLARQFLPSGDVIGKRIRWALGNEGWRTIVGVVRDVRGFALEVGARPQIYHTFAQSPNEESMAIVVLAEPVAIPSLRNAIQEELKQLDAALPVAKFRMMDQLVTTSVARPRFSALLLGLLAATALVLTSVGLYGVVAYGVSQRTREIGIRMALGARQTTVLGLVIRQGLQPVLSGLCLGLPGSIVVMRLLASQLYEVQATDPATISLVVGCLLLISFAACYIPARRAARIDPTLALRQE